jgi:Na+-transporting NADH:ubiquinone oxidoreductase subunit NqrE
VVNYVDTEGNALAESVIEGKSHGEEYTTEEKTFEGYTFVQALVYALSVGLGYLLAMLLFNGIRDRIEMHNVPRAFRGLPVYLMAAAILSLALFAF